MPRPIAGKQEPLETPQCSWISELFRTFQVQLRTSRATRVYCGGPGRKQTEVESEEFE